MSKTAAAVTKEFKYRSIDDLAKKAILEQQRRGLEEQHYATAFRAESVRLLIETTTDEAQKAIFQADLDQMQNSLAIWEGMIERYNDELLTLNENISKE